MVLQESNNKNELKMEASGLITMNLKLLLNYIDEKNLKEKLKDEYEKFKKSNENIKKENKTFIELISKSLEEPSQKELKIKGEINNSSSINDFPFDKSIQKLKSDEEKNI